MLLLYIRWPDLVRHVSGGVFSLLVHRPGERLIFVAPDVSRMIRSGCCLVIFAPDLVGGHLELAAAELAARRVRAQGVTLVHCQYFSVLGKVGIHPTPALLIQYSRQICRVRGSCSRSFVLEKTNGVCGCGAERDLWG